MNATQLFETAIEWLRQNYLSFRFFTERDIVWTLQTHIIKLIETNNLLYKIFNDYPILPAKRGHIRSDLAIVDDEGIKVAAEFKYEPSHERSNRDIPKPKFPVVFWATDGVGIDVERAKEFVINGGVEVAYSVFIDEGGYFRRRDPHPGSKWIDWRIDGAPSTNISILWSKWEKN